MLEQIDLHVFLRQTLGLVLTSAAHAIEYLCNTRYSIVQKLSDKKSAKVICRFDRLRTVHSKS